MIFPWYVRRKLMCSILNFKIHKNSKIGLAIILSEKLEMDQFSRIGNFTICNSIDLLKLFENSKIGTFNYITGYSTRLNDHFSHVENRKCELILEEHSAITSRHFLDCTAGILIGKFSTVAGIRSQFLTHSIDLFENRQNAKSIEIGSFAFIGTNCVILPGSSLPSYTILGAKSLLNKKLVEEKCLYGGVPAIKIKELDLNKIDYFTRSVGFVN
jgi:acetyltransferase-like isoleucine patch superfamily enzyme